MNSLTLKNTSKAVAWIMAVSMAFAFSVPSASAFVSRGNTSSAKWVAQTPGAASGGSTVINAEGGDVLDFSLTIQNTSATDVFYSADALLDEPAPWVGAHEFRVGATNDTVYSNIFDFSDNTFVNNNRFATFTSGPAVMPGQNLTFNWKMDVKEDIADGTYRFSVGVVQEYDAWLGDQPGPGAGGPMNNLGGRSGGTIFWDIVIGEGSAPSGDLEGTTGDITVTALSTFGDEEVGEDEDDVEVAAFEVEADDSSDVEITSIKVELAQQNADDSAKLDDYASEISIWMDGEEVGRADADEFTENGDDYTKAISLDDAIIRMGETAEFTLAVSGLSNLDSGDIDTDDWQIGVSSIRFMDGDGVVTTDSFTLDIDDNTVDDTIEEEFDFASFAAASGVELKVALNDDEDEINDAHVIDIDDTDDTDDVEILAFTIEADGDSDLLIEEIPVTVTTTGEADEAVLVQNARLWFDGEAIASDTIPTGGAVVFEDIDIEIEAGEMAEFVVSVDIQDTAGVADNGDTVQASVTSSDDIVAEDEAGETIGNDDASGAAVGGTHGVFDAGMYAEFVSATAEAIPSGVASVPDQGMFTITFDVTAFDSDVFIDGSAITDETGGATYQDITVTNVVATGVVDSDADTAANSTFRVREGQTERFTITMSGPAAADVFASASLDSILYALTAVDGDVVYNFNMTDFKTTSVFLNDNA